jgi:hypothetical protein
MCPGPACQPAKTRPCQPMLPKALGGEMVTGDGCLVNLAAVRMIGLPAGFVLDTINGCCKFEAQSFYRLLSHPFSFYCLYARACDVEESVSKRMAHWSSRRFPDWWSPEQDRKEYCPSLGLITFTRLHKPRHTYAVTDARITPHQCP